MKKFIAVSIFAGMLMTLSVVANAAQSYRERVEEALANQPPPGLSDLDFLPQRPDTTVKPIDRRIITPAMNSRERVEVMRDIKKRAAAMRNQLMQAAELEIQQQAPPVSTGYPSS